MGKGTLLLPSVRMRRQGYPPPPPPQGMYVQQPPKPQGGGAESCLMAWCAATLL